MKIKPDVALRVSLPGYTHNVEITGHPAAGEVYLRSGVVVGRMTLGNPAEGCAYGNASSPVLEATSLAEWDEIIAAATQARERMALWFPIPKAVA